MFDRANKAEREKERVTPQSIQYSASNRNEYQGISIGGNLRPARTAESSALLVVKVWMESKTFYPRQMKHQLDATLCRFYFYRVTLHVSGASAHHQEYLKLVQRPLVHVLSL